MLGHDPARRVDRAAPADRDRAASGRHLRPHHPARGARATGPASTRTRATSRRCSRWPGSQREGGRAQPHALRRAAAAAGLRAGARRRPRADLPRRADDRLRPGGAPQRPGRRCARCATLGKTILLTTHYLDEAQALADRVAIVKDGRILAIGPPRELGVGGAGDATASPTATATASWSSARPTTRPRCCTSSRREALARGERLRRADRRAPDARGRLPGADRRCAEAARRWAGASTAWSDDVLAQPERRVLQLPAAAAVPRGRRRDPHGNQRELEQAGPGDRGDERDVDDVHRARLQHRVPARARRAQADPRHAAADALLLRRRGRQRRHQHGAADRDRDPRRARCSSASAGRRTGSS